ncbi:hypothetical protein AB0H69_09900 [Streptomyces phaeochromogenes]|uniref:hypothetical protein n=1 Tax=Streptomyces phaeochromogenes TaxID=1923 RepID=UPI0033DE151C
MPVAVRPRPGQRQYRPRLHHRQFGLIEVRSRRRHHRGAGLDDAKGQIAKTQTKLGTVSKVDCGKYGKPGSTVIQVDPHSPKAVTNGDTVEHRRCDALRRLIRDPCSRPAPPGTGARRSGARRAQG